MRGQAISALAAGAALLAVACGSSGGGPSSTTHSASLPPTTSTPTPQSTPTSSAQPTPTPRPPSAPEPVAVVAWAKSPNSAVALYGVDGRALGFAVVSSTAGAPYLQSAPGPDSVYYTNQGHLQKMSLDGQVRDLGPLPSPVPQDGFVVSPDGRSLAYAVRSGWAEYSWHNQLWVAPIGGGAPRLLADRAVSMSVTPSDAPASLWAYGVRDWTPLGIVVARTLVGIGGNYPFIGESYDGYSALVNPATGQSTMLTNNSRCPLSTLAADGTAVCFRRGSYPNVGVNAIVLRSLDGAYRTWTMSGQNLAGWAAMDPATQRLAYDTVPLGDEVDDWPAAVTLRVLDMASGQARPLGPVGTRPLGWLGDGGLLALRLQLTDTGTFRQTLLRVDPATGSWRVLGTLRDGEGYTAVVTR